MMKSSRKQPSSKARRKPARGLAATASRRTRKPAAVRPPSPRQEFRAWRASLPAGLERDTLLMPDVIAENIVAEVERFLDTTLSEGFAERLAAKAHRLYPRHRHFHAAMNRPGNRGRENLHMYMRHWTAGWLKRERYALHKRLPHTFGLGHRL